MSLLSKSKYLIGLQCPKHLWLSVHDPSRIPEPDESTQYRFSQGHLVGELAKKVFLKGIDVPVEDFSKNLKLSKEFLSKRKPLFEAAFMFENLYSRADILNPVNKDEWDIIEVKSGTSVKEPNVDDVTFQNYCYTKSGLKIRKCILMHINNEFVKNGKIDPNKLFTQTEISDEVKETDVKVSEMLKIMNLKECPSCLIGVHSIKPYECPLKDECWSSLPDDNIFDLYSGGKKCFDLYEKGIESIADIPDDYKLSSNQSIQKECSSGKVHIEKSKIKEFLSTLIYPLHYLDFETYSTTIPLYDGLKPYQAIPFQFSLHVDSKKSVKHHSFLSTLGDSRLEFLKALKAVIGPTGSIVAYNQSFEKNILKSLSVMYPSYKNWVDSILDRFVDLLIPFRKFYYYNPKQKGSASIKYVLPAITGKDYSGLGIADGETASLEYMNMIHGPKQTKEEIMKIREDLENYCKLDTEGMVWIVERLGKV